MKRKTAKLTIVNNKTFEAAKTANLNLYDLVNALQTTLDLTQLVTIFSNKIQQIISHSGVFYVHDEFELEYKNGIASKHSFSYHLSIDNMELGELTLMRQLPFSEHELHLLETLLCGLIYPLRNATLYKQAQQMAHTDPLTKTQNRIAFNDMIEREYRLANRNNHHLSLIFIDIDYFKSINDTYGHECGDIALASVANLLRNSIRCSDLVFRYGGEEFVILLSETSVDKASEIAERVRITIENHTLAYGMQTINMTVSLGISSLLGNDSTQSFINRADRALYHAKLTGRNKVCIGR